MDMALIWLLYDNGSVRLSLWLWRHITINLRSMASQNYIAIAMVSWHRMAVAMAMWQELTKGYVAVTRVLCTMESE